MIEVESFEIFAPYEGMGAQFAHVVAVQEDLGGVHRQLVGQIGKFGARTFGDVFGPRIVMVAGAIVWTSHFTITCVVFTTMT